MKKTLFAFLSLFFFFSFFSGSAQAQVMGLGISPTTQPELVNPGQVLSRYVKVSNRSDAPITLYVYLKDFKAGDESGKPILMAPGTESGSYLATWIDITSEGIDLKPNEEKEVPFKVYVPEQAGPGGYYGGIFFGTQPPKINIDSEDKGAGMAVAFQNGSLLLYRVSGDVNESANIREFNTDKDLYGTPFMVDFVVRIQNTGNVHVQPFGYIEIENMFGRQTARIPVNESRGNVLPDSTRRFGNLVFEDNMGFGRYKATLGLTYGLAQKDGGQGQGSLVAVKTFWIIPWKIVLPVLLILLLISGGFIVFLNKYKDKAVKKAMSRAGVAYRRGRSVHPSPILHFTTFFFSILLLIFIILIIMYFLFFA